MFSYFKKPKPVPPTEQFYTPLRVSLHTTIELTTVDLVVNKPNLHPAWIIPGSSLEVLAIGNLTMGQAPIHQLYVMDENQEEFIIQLVEGKTRTGEPRIDEINLFKQIVSLQPETEASLNRHLSNIGFLTIPVDDIEFDREWGDRYTEKAEFRKFPESVITPTGPQSFTNEWMLYKRKVPSVLSDDEIDEMLLVGIEEGEDQAQIIMQIGVKLNLSDLNIL